MTTVSECPAVSGVGVDVRAGGSSNVTDEMWWLWTQLQALEPKSALGGIYANKPGYHNCRSNLPSSDYSVCDRPPDGGGPSWAACAIDWTFYNAQSGDYSTISKYTKRLLASARDPNDPRLDGWREFYGQADSDSYVEGWDIRYGVAATSDSSHLWHLHISENRDQSQSMANKQALLSVLKGETVEEWEDDVTAKDVWAYDIDPTEGSYTSGGSMWTMLNRTGYLANTFAPQVLAAIEDLQTRQAQTETQSEARAHVNFVSLVLALFAALLAVFALIYVMWGPR